MLSAYALCAYICFFALRAFCRHQSSCQCRADLRFNYVIWIIYGPQINFLFAYIKNDELKKY